MILITSSTNTPPPTPPPRADLLREVAAIAAANPATMRAETRAARDQEYKVDMMVSICRLAVGGWG
jgi:hypothetical protein